MFISDSFTFTFVPSRFMAFIITSTYLLLLFSANYFYFYLPYYFSIQSFIGRVYNIFYRPSSNITDSVCFTIFSALLVFVYKIGLHRSTCLPSCRLSASASAVVAYIYFVPPAGSPALGCHSQFRMSPDFPLKISRLLYKNTEYSQKYPKI